MAVDGSRAAFEGDGERGKHTAAPAAHIMAGAVRFVHDGVSWVRRDSRSVGVILPAVLVGLIYTLRIFDVAFISGIGPCWEHLQLWDMDRAQALIGWRYFAHDSWRFPLFWVPTLNYPEGANIIFTDSIPLVALLFKIAFKLTGVEVNYLGAWMVLCYVLQGVAAALLLAALGVRNRIANLCGVLIALSAPLFLSRFGHEELCAHFLILFSLACYFRLVEGTRQSWRWVALVAVPVAALLIEAYLAVMLAAITMAAVLEALRRRVVSPVVAVVVLTSMVGIAAGVMGVSGMIGRRAPSPIGGGFGHFSMNVLAPFFGRADSYTQRLLGPVIIDATGGQYEGFNYLGAGILMLAAVWFVSGPRRLFHAIRTHPVLAATLVLLSLYALSNRVFVGATEVFQCPLPAFAMRLADTYRSSGRFFWPVYYVITIGLLASVWRRFPGPLGLAILAVVAVVQYAETRTMRLAVSNNASRINPSHFVDTAVMALVDRADRLFVYPSFECTQGDPEWPRPGSWRGTIMELLLYTSGRALPTNSMYVNRRRKDCQRERQTFPNTTLDSDTLYVVRRADARALADDLGDTATCLAKGAAFLCATNGEVPRPDTWTWPASAAMLGAENAVQSTEPHDALFVSQDVPDVMTAGEAATVSLTFRNTGAVTWTPERNYRLGSQRPQDNQIWGATRVFLDALDRISPGQEKTFRFAVMPPMMPGTYPFQWQMVQEEIAWFGERNRDLLVTVKARD